MPDYDDLVTRAKKLVDKPTADADVKALAKIVVALATKCSVTHNVAHRVDVDLRELKRKQKKTGA